MSALVETEGLTVTFGGLNANDSVNIVVEQGTFVGLIGPNGAGKTTFIDAITGFVTPSAGLVRFDGRDITGLPAHERARLGLCRTWQSLELFEDLSVKDNLLVAAERPRWYSFITDMLHLTRAASLEDRVEWALEAVGLSGVGDALPSDLSHGRRKLVGVARALVAQPQLVLLDEPAAGLDTMESKVLGSELRRLLDAGITVFLIDHDMGLVLNVCDYLYVLDFGRIIAEGTAAQIRTDPAVVAAYLGESAAEAQAHGEDALAVVQEVVEQQIEAHEEEKAAVDEH
jgi:branched-chain amino acid transport system ATP-binding protein